MTAADHAARALNPLSTANERRDAIRALVAQAEAAAQAEIVVHVDSFGAWTIRPGDERPELRYPSCEAAEAERDRLQGLLAEWETSIATEALKDDRARLADALRKIADGRWNVGRVKDMDVHSFARAALARTENVPPDLESRA